MKLLALAACLILAAVAARTASAQCPWSRNVPALHGSCACSYNLAQELTLQCAQVDFAVLVTALNEHAASQTIDLLYVHNSTVGELRDNLLSRLTVHNVQLSKCSIRSIGTRAFAGQEVSLKNLNLQDNVLTAVPTEALRPLKALALLDLSGNRIGSVPDDAFGSLKLITLKLADNGNLSLSDNSFRGLEKTLKNLNLKGTKLKSVPAGPIRQLSNLAFLDLAQNGIRSIAGGLFRGLDSLTALNLERNSLTTVDPDAFVGVNDTLSSLSLLNNLIVQFPVTGLAPLTQLRVLDVGFNLMDSLPDDAFAPSPLLTLLALDGNPLASLPRRAFAHLNGTLRGLSLGGKFLECDCRLRWVAEWIRDTDLQVTSRERSPQFCGSPPEFRTRSFYQLAPEDLKCVEKDPKAAAPAAPEIREESEEEREEEGFRPVTASSPAVPSTTTTSPPTSAPTTFRPSVTTGTVMEVSVEPDDEEEDIPLPIALPPPAVQSTTPPTRRPQQSAAKPTDPPAAGPVRPNPTQPYRPRTTLPANKLVRGGSGSGSRTRPYGRPNLITGSPNSNYHLDPEGTSANGIHAGEREVVVKDAYRQDTAVVIQWDSEVNNILGFRVVYRLFGDNSFQPGPPLDPSEREFKIKNVPAQESLVVCVVSLEESHVTPETVPFPQCREIRSENPSGSSSHMDKIIIAASAAICGTVVVAVVIFICCNRKRSAKSEKLRLSNVLAAGGGAAIVHHNGGGGGMSTAATSVAGSHVQSPLVGSNGKDWDQLSMYSTRSIPRARMYHSDQRPGSVMGGGPVGAVNGGFIPDDARSHVSGAGSAAGVNLIRSRSLIDGQLLQQGGGGGGRSVSALSGRGATYLPPGLHHQFAGAGLGLSGLNMGGLSGSMSAMAGLPTALSGLGLSRADLRASHHSLADLRMSEIAAAAAAAGRASRASRASGRMAGGGGGGGGGMSSSVGGGSRRSEQMRRRAASHHQGDSSDQQQAAQQTTGDESSWETDREPGPSSGGSTSGLLAAASRRQQVQQQLMRQSSRMRHRSGGMDPNENWTDMDMDIYMAHNTMRQHGNDLVRL